MRFVMRFGSEPFTVCIMLTRKKMLLVGVENFEKLIQQDFYYVDKTGIIAKLLYNWGEVNLFTRPRRFGKSLNMNMLKCFFEIGCDKSIFDRLKISEETELCEKYMGQFPMISISLKGVEGQNFQNAGEAMKCIIGDEALRFQFLLESEKLSDSEKEQFRQLIQPAGDDQSVYGMSEVIMISGLRRLSSLLAKHYGKKVIILIDEYDVPLDKAFQNGYYDEVVLLLRNLFGNALKTNENLFLQCLPDVLEFLRRVSLQGLII